MYYSWWNKYVSLKILTKLELIFKSFLIHIFCWQHYNINWAITRTMSQSHWRSSNTHPGCLCPLCVFVSCGMVIGKLKYYIGLKPILSSNISHDHHGVSSTTVLCLTILSLYHLHPFRVILNTSSHYEVGGLHSIQQNSHGFQQAEKRNDCLIDAAFSSVPRDRIYASLIHRKKCLSLWP